MARTEIDRYDAWENNEDSHTHTHTRNKDKWKMWHFLYAIVENRIVYFWYCFKKKSQWQSWGIIRRISFGKPNKCDKLREGVASHFATCYIGNKKKINIVSSKFDIAQCTDSCATNFFPLNIFYFWYSVFFIVKIFQWRNCDIKWAIIFLFLFHLFSYNYLQRHFCVVFYC